MYKKLFFLIILHFTFLIFNSSIAYAVEVGGHLIEDTIWSPENNPYLVTETLYVDSDVTLTILPGTEIKISSASCTSWDEFNQNFWLYGGVSVAKMIQVDGRLIAEGTAQDSITFTRMQNDPDYYWGCIYFTEQSEMPIFQYCEFKYSAGIGIAVSNTARGAISIRNGTGLIKYCTFNNNGKCISAYFNLTQNIEISNCYFSYDENINNFVENIWGRCHITIYQPASGFKPALLANNYFNNDRTISASSVYYVDNFNNNCKKILTCTAQNTQISYFYDNNFNNCETGIEGGDDGDSLFIKNNRFIGGYEGIAIDDTYVEISSNYFEGCDLDTGLNCNGQIYNNIIKEGNVRIPGYVEVYNNIGFTGEDGIIVTYRNETCYNILSLQNQYAFDGAFSGFFNNCIFIANEEISNNGVSGNPIFRNCILDFELPPECIDGGGNIWVDSLQAQSLFEDIENGDFHLIEGSLAIDAGFDTLSYYYPFDMDYNHRVWDGNNNGTAIIDIGPYEFGSPAFGGIVGYTYNPTNGESVDYVLLKINNQPGEFTFSDSIGNFEYKLPAGIYDVYAERVFYEDVIEYQIEVFDGEFTQIAIPMFETVDVEDNSIIPSANILNLNNYPNPFNPTTTIAYSLPNDGLIGLRIFNVKGQLVKTLVDGEQLAGSYEMVWNGKDNNKKSVSSGIYFYKLSTKDKTIMKKMLMLK
ncbi:MAG: FlgD immunoglobulin-like domain containing protein [Candidatus Cloacimonadota bacterium]|nr:FlgD immunoglobulin-like domain containing protein [Candidatus Cloacimonadota bacterium]